MFTSRSTIITVDQSTGVRMRRYKYVDKEDIFASWNKLRNALLAAKDGSEVDSIMRALFTEEERFQLGRRIQIAECLKAGMTIIEICDVLKAGNSTIVHISRRLEKYPEGFELISKRHKKVEVEYEKGRYSKEGGSKKVFKKKTYTGLTRKDIKR